MLRRFLLFPMAAGTHKGAAAAAVKVSPVNKLLPKLPTESLTKVPILAKYPGSFGGAAVVVVVRRVVLVVRRGVVRRVKMRWVGRAVVVVVVVVDVVVLVVVEVVLEMSTLSFIFVTVDLGVVAIPLIIPLMRLTT